MHSYYKASFHNSVTIVAEIEPDNSETTLSTL